MTATKKQTFTATWTDSAGTILRHEERTSHRKYTHAAVYGHPQHLDKVYIGSFHSSEELAQAGTLTKLQRKQGLQVIAVVPVTVVEKPRPLTKPMRRTLERAAKDIIGWAAGHGHPRTLSALRQRGLINEKNRITEAGRAAIA